MELSVPAVNTFGQLSQRNGNLCSCRNVYMKSTAALLAVVTNWKLPKCHPVVNCENNSGGHIP